MLIKSIVAFIAAIVLSACVRAPDWTGVQREEANPLKRHDVVQTLAANDDVLVAGTQAGAVLSSKDSGATWTRHELGPVSLIGLASCPDGTFVGIDFYHKVWMGDPTGTEWKSSVLEKPRVPLTITCDPLNRWHVAGSGAKIARSSDQGATWQVSDLAEDAQFTALQMINEHNGIVLGEFGLVAKTEDGGVTWKKGASIGGDFYPYAVLFNDLKTGYASGLAGAVFRTHDGGNTWAKIDNETRVPLYRLFSHSGKVYGVGSGGIVARLDGGGKFQSVAYPDATPVFLGAGASVPGHSALVIGGPGGLIRVIGTQVN